MGLVSLGEVRSAGRRRYLLERQDKSSIKILAEASLEPLDSQFDVFLSHSYADAKLDHDGLLDLKAYLEELGISVYVDWIVDRYLERDQVDAATAEVLRTRMDHSRCLFFATTENSANSKWMPWELGYKDGQSSTGFGVVGRVAVLPLLDTGDSSVYAGQEYLGIYPYVDRVNDTLFINAPGEPAKFVRFNRWLEGANPGD